MHYTYKIYLIQFCVSAILSIESMINSNKICNVIIDILNFDKEILKQIDNLEVIYVVYGGRIYHSIL